MKQKDIKSLEYKHLKYTDSEVEFTQIYCESSGHIIVSFVEKIPDSIIREIIYRMQDCYESGYKQCKIDIRSFLGVN